MVYIHGGAFQTGESDDYGPPLWVRQTSTTGSTEALVPPVPQSYTATAFATDHKCAFWAAVEAAQ